MRSKMIAVVGAAGLVMGGALPVSAQLDGLYEFDGGGDGSSWDDAANWERVLSPTGGPLSGNPAAPPDAVTSVDIAMLGVVIDATMPGQTVLDLHMGTAAGAGSLMMTGGGLANMRDLHLGAGGNAGTFTLSAGVLTAGDDITVDSGGAGVLTIGGSGAVTTGDDLFVNTAGTFTMAGGSLMVGDRLIATGGASVSFTGGSTVIDDDWFLFGSAQATVDGGLVVVSDKLRFDDDLLTDGRLTINGGMVRSNEFGFVDIDDNHIINGVVEINGGGVYQVEAPGVGDPVSELSLAYAQQLIGDGVFVTTDPGLTLVATSVVVAEFDGRTDVVFTQVAAVPEPGSAALLGVSLGLLGRRRRGLA